MSTHDYYGFWNEANVTIRDIRYIRIEPSRERTRYRLPTSSYIYITRGSGVIWLDEQLHRASSNYLLHGAKGMELVIEASDFLEYYILLYRAERNPTRDSSSPKHAEALDPPLQPYGYAPIYPAELRSTMEQMYLAWKASTQLERLHVKSTFYHFVYHLLWQMQRQDIIPMRPNLLDQAIRYMNDHYNKPITIEMIADALNCSTRYLNKLFSQKLQDSPIRVLRQIRMDHAVYLLSHSDMSLHEIAERVSYSDARALSRVFKNHLGMSPLQYRMDNTTRNTVPKLSSSSSDGVVVSALPRCYIDNGYHNQLKYHRREEATMFKSSKPSIAAVMFICFAVLLGACGNATGNSPANSTVTNEGTVPSPEQTANAVEESAETSTKSYSDKFGERQIPVNPQKIYAMGAASPLLALGVQPIGAPSYEVAPDYYLSNYPDKINIVGDYPPNYEAIADLNPDLILAADYIDTEVYEQLAKIAPTATFLWQGQDIYDQLKQVAGIVGKTAEADEWIKTHHEKAEKAKLEVQQSVQPDETVSILWIYKDSFQVVGNRNVGHVIYDLLGIKPLPAIQQKIDEGKKEFVYTDKLSLEVLPEYDADHLIVMVSDVEAGSEENYKIMQESAIWKGLQAVKNNKVHEVPYDKWWSYTVLASDGLLKDSVELFKP
ncbi:ABC transporter substrate-binding protein [Paenibacillus sinopodophylli]|uniref:ABC transporter substrate-binding protein n=1 Tax=Paenibacillus sinopodophylli TaxID=1837342 RepID=UPI001486C887|nr:ABC transporter substrate-binding protein [Paenibacillus sinopodophylli]